MFCNPKARLFNSQFQFWLSLCFSNWCLANAVTLVTFRNKLFSIYGSILFWVIFSLVFRRFSLVFLWPKPSDFLLSHPNFNCSQCRRTRSHSIGFKHWLMTLGFLLDCYLGTPPNKSFIWMPGHLPFSVWIDVIDNDCLNLSFICFSNTNIFKPLLGCSFFGWD